MLEVMMALGSYRFGLSTAVYQELSRQAAWRWPEQERIGAASVRQFVGRGETTIRPTGTRASPCSWSTAAGASGATGHCSRCRRPRPTT